MTFFFPNYFIFSSKALHCFVSDISLLPLFAQRGQLNGGVRKQPESINFDESYKLLP